jgi:anti-sigma-K factor RskA
VSATDHDRYADDAGAYVLGALEDDERLGFERHIATCHVCRDEVDRLAVAAAALPASVEQYDAPATLKRSIMAEVRRDAARAPRRSWADRLGLAAVRPRIAVAAAGVALLVGAVAGAAMSGLAGDEPAGGTRTVAATVDATRVGEGRATLVVAAGDGPSALEVAEMPQPRRGQVYEVWLRRGDRIEPGPLFTVDRNGRGAAAVPGGLDGVDEVMVTRERAGGAHQPTEAPVISAGV